LYDSDVEIVSHAEGGSSSADVAADIAGILALYPDRAADGIATWCVIECGGSDVNDNRPYAANPAAAAALGANIATVIGAVQAKGFTPVLSDLTFRNYDETTYAKEQNGSRPFNLAVIRPLVRADWTHPSGRPF